MPFETILVEDRDWTRIITINRPKKLNALNRQTINELSKALDEAAEADSVRVVIITGAGEKAFVAGADIAEFASYSKKEGTQLSAEGHKNLFNKVERMPKPVIAAVNGFALGGGLELAMAAHFRIASENAQMGLPEVSLGVIPGYGGTQRLPQLVGKGRAYEMIFSASKIKADQALEWGLVNHVTGQDALLDTAEKIAAGIARNSPKAITAAIRSINAGFKTGEDGFKVEVEAFGSCFETMDFKEGTTAFMEKRKPEFKGE